VRGICLGELSGGPWGLMSFRALKLLDIKILDTCNGLAYFSAPTVEYSFHHSNSMSVLIPRKPSTFQSIF